MRSLLCLLACLTVLGGCASKPKDPSGIWINQAAIDAAVDSQHLREALLAYGPNLEWNLNSSRQQATFSNGFELADGQSALELRALRGAANRAVTPEINRRLGSLAAAADADLSLAPNGMVLWRGEAAGQVHGGRKARLLVMVEAGEGGAQGPGEVKQCGV